MTATLEELKTTASTLTSPERAELAHHLLLSLDAVEAGAAAEWLERAEQRMAEVRSGRVVGIPAEQVLEDMKRSRP